MTHEGLEVIPNQTGTGSQVVVASLIVVFLRAPESWPGTSEPFSGLGTIGTGIPDVGEKSLCQMDMAEIPACVHH